MMDHYRYPEFRVTVDNTLDGINPLDQSGFYVRCADATEARRRYREAHPRAAGLRLHVLRWKEPTPGPRVTVCPG